MRKKGSSRTASAAFFSRGCAAQTEKGRRRMRLRVRGSGAGSGFVPARIKGSRPIEMCGSKHSRAKNGPGGWRLSRPRPRLRPGRGERSHKRLGQADAAGRCAPFGPTCWATENSSRELGRGPTCERAEQLTGPSSSSFSVGPWAAGVSVLDRGPHGNGSGQNEREKFKFFFF
jgi:hypothetical protein